MTDKTDDFETIDRRQAERERAAEVSRFLDRIHAEADDFPSDLELVEWAVVTYWRNPETGRRTTAVLADPDAPSHHVKGLLDAGHQALGLAR